MNYQDLLKRTCDIANEFLDGLSDRAVGRPVDFETLLANMGGAIPLEGDDSLNVIEHLSKVADKGVVATAGPRYFGFVVGGSLPAAVAADWLTTIWDQNAGLYVLSPAAAAAEEIAGGWLRDLFGLPQEMSAGRNRVCSEHRRWWSLRVTNRTYRFLLRSRCWVSAADVSSEFPQMIRAGCDRRSSRIYSPIFSLLF